MANEGSNLLRSFVGTPVLFDHLLTSFWVAFVYHNRDECDVSLTCLRGILEIKTVDNPRILTNIWVQIKEELINACT